jgi:hypothetical protein
LGPVRWVCILSDLHSRHCTPAGIEHKCRDRRHPHFTLEKVRRMVRSGELVWVGQHRKIAKYTSHRTLAKVYTRNAAGEVLICGIQLVNGERR